MKSLTVSAILTIFLGILFAAAAFANGVGTVTNIPAVEPVVVPPPAPPAVPPAVTPSTPPGAGPTVTTGAPSTPCWTVQQLITMTVSEAWQLSGQNYTEFGKMTQALADLSAQKRGINVPDTMAAGQEIGRSIKQCAQADPNQLLYVVVDNAVRNYAVAHPQR